MSSYSNQQKHIKDCKSYIVYNIGTSLSAREPSSRNEKNRVSALKEVGILYDIIHYF
jgi:hypothetical protein